jgi:Fuc2NAc and GlcNAc transferase
VILLGVFVVDSTITLGRRVLRGERFYEAHRSHAYQHAAPMLGGHRPVTTIVGVINVAWLLPIALLVGTGAIVPPLGVAIAYTPLILAAFLLGAGVSPARPRVAERSEIQALPRRDVRARMV